MEKRFFEVWHVVVPDAQGYIISRLTPAEFPADFKKVALVQVPEAIQPLGRVFELTNHIDHPWWENDDVILVGQPDKRSTSVGDVISEPAFNRHWRVEPVGFTEFTPAGGTEVQ